MDLTKNYQFGNICSFLDQMSACPLDLVHCAWIGNFSVDLGTGRKEYHAFHVINALHSIDSIPHFDTHAKSSIIANGGILTVLYV